VKTHYINTDLEIEGGAELQRLATAFEAGGMFALNLIDLRDHWRANFEMVGLGETEQDPTVTIAAILDVIEALDGPSREIWQRCRKREFNLGFQCGSEPHSIEHLLPSQLLGRIANCGASAGFTLYAYTAES
jgi:hypothetical protein